MSDEIPELMEKRTSKQGWSYIQEYACRDRTKIWKAEEEWYIERCTEREELIKNNSVNLHKKVKELAGINRARKGSILLVKNDNIIYDVQCILARWKEYIQELFEDERQGYHIEDLPSEKGPDITREEVLHAIGLKRT